jgi:hypothetical protein
MVPESFAKKDIKGWVIVDVKPNDERMDLYALLSLKVEGETVTSVENPVQQGKIMNKIARDSIVEVDIEFDGVKYDKEALFMYEDFAPAIAEIATLCLKGPTLSKKL